ncbi:MAG: FecCD family ABC transporter permease [Thermoplasmata archaeon]
MKKMGGTKFISLSVIFFILVIIFSVGIGPVQIPFLDILKELFNPYESGPFHIIIWELRLPRILLASLVGASLAVSGAVMQGIFRNPLSDPYVTGTASGAALGATVAMIIGLSALNIYFLPLLAFLGAAGTTVIVAIMATFSSGPKSENMLLAGLGISIFFSAIVSYLMYVNGKDLQTVFYWLMGSFSGAQWNFVYIMIIFAVPSMIILALFGRDIDPIMIGEEHAYSLGIDIKKSRLLFFILSSLITGLSVAFSGIIGFVGLIIPHIVRIITGPNNRVVILSSIFIGGGYMVIADTIARSFNIIEELPVGIITSLIGVPVFLYLLMREKGYWR